MQLNCSAWLNEKDYIYWNFHRKDGQDPNEHEGEEVKIRYADVMCDGQHRICKCSCVIEAWFKDSSLLKSYWNVWHKL